MPPGSPPHQPPPPPPPAGPSGASGSLGASGSSKVPPPPPLPPSTNQEAQLSDDEDIENAHIPKVNLRQDWWKPLEEERPATPEPACKPLPLGGPPGQVTIQFDFFFNKDLEYLRYGSKGSRPALSILKMKAAYYPDVGLEKMVPSQMWIEEECKHTSEDDHEAVRTHIRILNVVRIKVFSMYGDFEDLYLLNLQGHLNHLPPNDKKILTNTVSLWTRHLVIQQRVEDFQLGIESYQTQLNLTKPRWDATGFEYKHDYIVIDYPRAITFQDRYGVQMIMRFNEIHKFSDGTM
nr:hypothetical protein [Tanacetum cinerariifolium]